LAGHVARIREIINKHNILVETFHSRLYESNQTVDCNLMSFEPVWSFKWLQKSLRNADTRLHGVKTQKAVINI
jgi:hypothetical protein